VRPNPRSRAGSKAGSKLRWLAGAAGASIVTATLLAFFPGSAGAAGDTVTAVFSMTGVNPDNCSTNLGGADAYLKPGQTLDVKSNLAAVTVGGIHVNVGDMDGKLSIDGKSYDVTSTAKSIGSLGQGNHDWKFSVSASVPGALGSVINLGVIADYSGTFHVTSDKNACGVAIQLPTVHASASVTHLPTVSVSIPGVKPPTVPVTVPSISLPNLPTSALPSVPGLPGGLPSLPGVGGSSGGSTGGGSTGSATLPVPARVVPGGGNQGQAGGGNGGTGGGGSVTEGQPPAGQAIGSGSGSGGGGGLLPATSNESQVTAVPALRQPSTGKHKTIDLAASKANSTGQFSVILAIISIIALSIVAATYARLYLLKRETPAV
jgi:hypothetical protein